jgi:UDP-N-acetylmuramyl tripeptide synthase
MPGDAVLVTGKGTDPYIMQANDAKLPWNDAQVVKEELNRLGHAVS